MRGEPIEHQSAPASSDAASCVRSSGDEQLRRSVRPGRCNTRTRPTCVHGGGGADRLPLAGAPDHRRLSLPGPRSCRARLSARKPLRLIPEVDLTAGGFGLSGQWPGTARAATPRSLPGSRWYARCSGFLRRQSQLGEQCSHRRHAKPYMANLRSISSATTDRVHNPKSRPYWRGSRAVDPAEHLLLLARASDCAAAPSPAARAALSVPLPAWPRRLRASGRSSCG